MSTIPTGPGAAAPPPVMLGDPALPPADPAHNTHAPLSSTHGAPATHDAALVGLPAQDAPHGTHDTSFQNVASGEKPLHDTNHQVHTPKPSSGSGVLSKLKPSSSKENIKTTTPLPAVAGAVPVSGMGNMSTLPGEGPRVTSETQPLAPVKDTRFSDTVLTAPPPLAMGDVVVPPGGVTTPGHAAESKTSNKLKKKQDVDVMPGLAPHGSIPGTAAPDLHGTAVPMPTAKPADIPILEEIVLPDGTRAYVRSGSAPSLAPMPAGGMTGLPNIAAAAPSTLSKKDKSKEKVDITADTALPGALGHIPAESEMGRGHCMMCCPTAPHDASGRPIFPCAHQDGVAGPSAMDRAQAASLSAPGAAALPGAHALGGSSGGERKKGDKVVVPPSGMPDIPLPPGDEVAINQENVGMMPPFEGPGSGLGGGKLKKGKGPAGGDLSPEDAMEDARKLAGESKYPRLRIVCADRVAKQKAAAETAGEWRLRYRCGARADGSDGGG